MTAYQFTVTATDRATGLSGTATAPFTVGPSLPAGVTLRQIDGGPAYYADNGFTYAATVDPVMAAAGAKSWDDPSWFPIGCFWSFYQFNSVATFRDLGLNFNNVSGPDIDMGILRQAGIWNIDSEPNMNYGPETIGLHVEEPNSWNAAGDNTSVVHQVTNSPFPLTGRFIQTCFTAGQLGYEHLSDTANMQQCFTTPIPTQWGSVRCTLPGADKYYFATVNIPSSQNDSIVIETGKGGTPATPDQMARGTNYGDMIDLMREWNPGVPVWPAYIENDDGLLGGNNPPGVVITPGQMNWAVWSTLIHGARAICYFATASDHSWTPTFGFGTTVQSGQQVSVYAQAKATNGLVQSLARILNSPFATGYVTASPAAYNFGQVPLVSQAHGRNGWTTGIDVMAKYFTGAGTSYSPGFYVFATYRGSQTAAAIPATFTTAGGYSGPVTAINADGGGTTYGTTYSLTASNGVFTDTLARGSSVRIYYIPAR